MFKDVQENLTNAESPILVPSNHIVWLLISFFYYACMHKAHHGILILHLSSFFRSQFLNLSNSEIYILCLAAQGAWMVTCSDEDLVKQANEWTIEGKDLISEVTCKEPYEWKETTDEEWEFSDPAKTSKAEPSFHVNHSFLLCNSMARLRGCPDYQSHLVLALESAV